MNARKIMKTVVYFMSSLIASIMIGTILMIAVYCLPVSAIRINAKKSLSIYERENDGYNWAPGISSSHLDNFTDSLMINNAVFLGTGSVIDDAMNNPWLNYEDLSKSLGLVKALSEDTLDNGIVVNYARYWHGYLILLKPLLCIITMSDIRILNMCFQLFLGGWVIIELFRLRGYRLVIPYGLAILSLNPISTVLCMQYACVYSVTLMGTLIMIKKKTYQSENYWHLFVWIGICTAFFDFLTYPIVGLGINLLLMISLMNSGSVMVQLKKIVASSISWALGYAGMWSGKWLISYVLTGNNTLLEGIGSVKFRSFGPTTPETGIEINSALQVISANINQLWNTPTKWMLFLCIIIFLFTFFIKKYRLAIAGKTIFPIAIVGVYPFLWYSVIRNHSAVHSWFTYRNLSITILAICLIVSLSLKGNVKDDN